jgi:hypothetical protein
MSKKALPNELFDIGFIFLQRRSQNSINPQSLGQGYYLVDVDRENREVEIRK